MKNNWIKLNLNLIGKMIPIAFFRLYIPWNFSAFGLSNLIVSIVHVLGLIFMCGQCQTPQSQENVK